MGMVWGSPTFSHGSLSHTHAGNVTTHTYSAWNTSFRSPHGKLKTTNAYLPFSRGEEKLSYLNSLAQPPVLSLGPLCSFCLMPAPQRRYLAGCGWEHECKLTWLQCGHLGDHDPRVKACRSSPRHKPTYVQTLRVTKKISYNPNSPSGPSGAATLLQHLATAQRATVI